jgi:hypothetical protein
MFVWGEEKRWAWTIMVPSLNTKTAALSSQQGYARDDVKGES